MDVEENLSDLIDDRDFQTIAGRFDRFNLFEAVGAVRGELKHSEFLAFLMSPGRSHGLGSQLLQLILRQFLAKTPKEGRPIRALKVAVGDLDGAVVYREQDNIDLLIEIRELNLVVVIENKVDAKAGDGQLARYKTIVRQKYSGWRHFFVFLTPDVTDPDDRDYISFSYVDLARVIEGFAAERAASHPSDVALILRHYIEMLRRHIVPDEELRDLAQQIYQRHKEALDFIFECRPEPGSLLSTVRILLEEQGGLRADRHVNSILRFVPSEWDGLPALNSCPREIWTKSGRNVLFEVKSFKTEAYKFSDRILLSLVLGPSEGALRQYIFDRVRARPDVFVGAGKTIGNRWVTIFARERLIPSPNDHDLCAHWRFPIDMIIQGRSMSLFQASQQWARMSS